MLSTASQGAVIDIVFELEILQSLWDLSSWCPLCDVKKFRYI